MDDSDLPLVEDEVYQDNKVNDCGHVDMSEIPTLNRNDIDPEDMESLIVTSIPYIENDNMMVDTNESNEEDSDEENEEDKKGKKKSTKAKAKTKKVEMDENNAKACNCGKCDDCKNMKKKGIEERVDLK